MLKIKILLLGVALCFLFPLNVFAEGETTGSGVTTLSEVLNVSTPTGDIASSNFVEGDNLNPSGVDFDGDTVSDEKDNCPEIFNKDQLDSDNDRIGDLCDKTPYPDRDGDEIADEIDNCLNVYNPLQEDENEDSLGDLCAAGFPDIDKDGVRDEKDNCPYLSNPLQEDSDKDSQGDKCEKGVYIPEEDKPKLNLEFTKEPIEQINEENIKISFRTNFATEGAIRYGFSSNLLSGYSSDLSSSLDHVFLIKKPKGKVDNFYYSVVAVSYDNKLESDLIGISLVSSSNDNRKQALVISQNEKEKAISSTIEKTKSIYEKNKLLYPKIAEASINLQDKIIKVLYLVGTIMLAMFVLMDEKHVVILFSDLKEALRNKK